MITYDYYRIFYFVAQYHSFSKAAEILNNNQPNITRCINNLEHELDCRLFLRSNRGVQLTPEGERLFSHVAVAYEQLQYGEAELKKDRSLDSGLITIGVTETALRIFLLEKLEAFHTQFPNVRLKIWNHSTLQAIHTLENGTVDFAVVTTPFAIKKPLKSTPLYSFQEILLGGKRYQELAGKIHSLKDLTDYPFVSLGNQTSTRNLYIQYFMNHNLSFNPDMEASTADQILPMIIHNLGIGFYPEELAKDSISKGLLFPIRLRETLPTRKVCLITDSGRPQSTAVKKILKTLPAESS